MKTKTKEDKMTIKSRQMAFLRVLLPFLLLLILLSSCRSQAITIRERTDSVKIQKEWLIDSVFVDRYHVEKEKGDTLFVHDSIFIHKYKYVDRVDSIIVRDSVPYPVEVVREVRRRNLYDRATSWGFWVFFLLFVLIIILKFYVMRFRR